MKFFLLICFASVLSIEGQEVHKRSKRFLFDLLGKQKERLHIKIIEKPVYIDRPVIKHVDRPIIKHVDRPVYIEKEVQVPVEKPIPVPYEVPVEKPVPYYIPQPVQQQTFYYQKSLPKAVITPLTATSTIGLAHSEANVHQESHQEQLVTDISSHGYSSTGGHAKTYNYHSTINGPRNLDYGYTGEIFLNKFGQLCDRNGVPLPQYYQQYY